MNLKKYFRFLKGSMDVYFLIQVQLSEDEVYTSPQTDTLRFILVRILYKIILR
jgi:hypothetical protein